MDGKLSAAIRYFLLLLSICLVGMVDGQRHFKTPLPCDWREINATAIPADTQWLTITTCRHLQLQPGELHFLDQLQKFTMVAMPIITEFPNITEVADTVQDVELFFNNISYINPDYLAAFANLENLNLGSNPYLDHIPDVPQLGSLLTLHIKGTAFTRIPQLTHAVNLKTLSISRVQSLRYIHKDDLKCYPNIRSLKMFGNNLKELPNLGLVNSTLKELNMKDGLMSSAPATHMIGLRSLVTLDVSGAPHLEVVPSLCHENVAGLSMRVGGSALRLCDCRNAWLKQAAEAGANIEAANATCGGLSWHNLTTQQLLQVCTDGSYDGRVRKSFWESVPVDRPCAFPLHSILYDTPLSLCVNTCFDKIPGCLSFNFRPQLEDRTRGDCVFVAPTAASPMQAPESALADTEGWMYVGAV